MNGIWRQNGRRRKPVRKVQEAAGEERTTAEARLELRAGVAAPEEAENTGIRVAPSLQGQSWEGVFQSLSLAPCLRSAVCAH